MCYVRTLFGRVHRGLDCILFVFVNSYNKRRVEGWDPPERVRWRK